MKYGENVKHIKARNIWQIIFMSSKVRLEFIFLLEKLDIRMLKFIVELYTGTSKCEFKGSLGPCNDCNI